MFFWFILNQFDLFKNKNLGLTWHELTFLLQILRYRIFTILLAGSTYLFFFIASEFSSGDVNHTTFQVHTRRDMVHESIKTNDIIDL